MCALTLSRLNWGKWCGGFKQECLKFVTLNLFLFCSTVSGIRNKFDYLWYCRTYVYLNSVVYYNTVCMCGEEVE